MSLIDYRDDAMTRVKVLRGLMFVTALAVATPASAQMIWAGQIARKKEKDRQRLLKITAAEFQKKVVVKDDDLETVATLSTVKGFPTPQGLFDVQGVDVFLRANISKRTGEATFQLYGAFFYKETSQREYTSVNYQDGGEIRDAKLLRLSSRVVSCDKSSAVLGCVRNEDVAFEVPERLLREVAAAAPTNFWRFKFRARAGDDWEDQIVPAEAAGLLAAVDTYRAAKAAK